MPAHPTAADDDAGSCKEPGAAAPAGPVENLARSVSAASPHILDGLRRQVADWATRAGLLTARIQDLVLAVYEAMANVVAHAYNGHPGALDLHARRHGDTITVTVTDRGTWRPAAVPAPDALHGRGLPLIHTLADEATFTTSPAGTTVDLSWHCTALR